MIFRVSQKTNVNGWRRQATIDHDNKTVRVEAFQFHCGDLEGLTATQFKQLVEYYKNNGFKEV